MQKKKFEIGLRQKSNVTSKDYELAVVLKNMSEEAQKFSSSSFYLGLHYGNWYNGISLKPVSPLPHTIGAHESIETVLLSGSDLPKAMDGELIVPTPPSGENDLRQYENLAGLAKTGSIEIGVIFSYPKPYEVLLPRELRFWRKRKFEIRSKEERLTASMKLSAH